MQVQLLKWVKVWKILKSEIALLWNRELLVVNANSVNQDIIIYVQMLYFLQLLQFRDVMKNLSLFQKMCFKLPENVSTKEGALIEPLSVGFYAAEQGNVGTGDTVVILGSGCIGLVTLLACKAHGAGQIIVADLVQARLDKAMELGATAVINSGKEDALEKIKELTGGRGADVVFETAGSPVTIAQTPFIVRRGGTITLVGISSKEEINYNFAQIMDKEATIKSVFRYKNIYPKAIAAVASGAIDVKNIVTHEFDLDHIKDAYDEAVNNKTDLVKAVIKVK